MYHAGGDPSYTVAVMEEQRSSIRLAVLLVSAEKARSFSLRLTRVRRS